MVNCEGKVSGMAIPLLIYLHGSPPRGRVRVVLAQLKSYPLNGLGFILVEGSELF